MGYPKWSSEAPPHLEIILCILIKRISLSQRRTYSPTKKGEEAPGQAPKDWGGGNSAYTLILLWGRGGMVKTSGLRPDIMPTAQLYSHLDSASGI